MRAAKTRKAPLVPTTIARLNSLKSGQEMIYYKGNLEVDIARCNPAKGNGGTPNYQALLRSIKDAAWNLSQSGAIRLINRPVTRDFGKTRYIEYVAVGLAGG